MKKTLLLFAMLLGVVGAWAEVELPKVSTIAEKHYYVIRNLRSGKYAYYNGDNSDIKQKVAPTSSDEVNNYIWYLTADGENYKLHNLGTQYTYAAVNSFTPNGTTVYIKENPYREGYVVISKNATVTTANSCWDDQDRTQEVGKVGWYEPRNNDNEGTSWTFEELSPATEVQYTITDEVGNNFTGSYDCCVFNGQKSLPRTKSVGLKNVEWNESSVSANVEFPILVSSETVTNPTLIVNGASWGSPNSRKWRAVKVDETDYVKAQTTAVDQDDVDALWAVYPVLADGTFKFVVKNLKTNTYVKADPDATGNGSDVTGATKPVSLAEKGTAFEYKVRTGSNYHFTYVNTEGTELRLSMNGSADTDVFLGVYSGSHSGNDVAFPDYVGNMTFPFSVSSARVTNPTMISSFGSANYGTSNYKWYADGVNIRNKKATSATNANVLSHMWAIYPSVNNDEIVYTIKNLQTGTYVYSTSSSNSHGDGVVTLSETASVLTFEDNKFKLSTGKYLSNNSSTGANGRLQTIGTWDSHDGCLLSFPAVTYEVTVGTAGYASLYTPIAGTLTGTARMITSEDIQDGYVTFGDVETNVSTPIPANQGAIVIGEGTYTFTAGDVTADWSANLLKGSAVNTYVEGEAYVLSAPDNKVGLYKATLNKNADGETGTTHFLNNAGKAYLPVSALTAEAAEARFFVFDFGGEETAIENVEAENAEQNAVVYDLAGRRVQNAQKGIFIVNGKVVIK